MTTVSYINKEGGVHSQALNCKTMLLYDWAIPMGTQLQVAYQPGVDIILAYYLSQNVVCDTTEWMFDRRMVRYMFEMWDRP